MAFWSSEKLIREAEGQQLVEPFDKAAVKHGAYELSLGPEAYLTSKAQVRLQLKARQQLAIPPGQFGFLLTEESVRIPASAIGFISIKAGIKFRGLVNVSGFHVDPGFTGRLKFSVYNAGSETIVLERGKRLFLLWFADLDQETADRYNGDHANQNSISATDVMLFQGAMASPAQLKADIDALGHKIDNLKWFYGVIVGLLVAMLVATWRGWALPSVSSLVNAVSAPFETQGDSTSAQ